MRSVISSSLTDPELMQRVLAGDADALQMLYDRHFRRGFALAYRMLTDAAGAEDCVQDMFLKLWQQPALFDPARGAFTSWLMSSIHHRAANQLRARSRVTSLSAAAPDDDASLTARWADPPDPAPSVEDQVWTDEQRRKVRAALGHLAPAQREALELAYYGGLSQSEVAARLGQPLGTIKTRMRTGLLKLRALLAESGVLSEL